MGGERHPWQWLGVAEVVTSPGRGCRARTAASAGAQRPGAHLRCHGLCGDGGTGPAPRPAALPPKGAVGPRRWAGPPGPEPRRWEAGGEPRRQAPEGGRSGGRAAARPPNRAQPNRQGREGTPEVGQATGRQARRRGVSPDHPHRRGVGGRPEPWRGGQAAAVRPQPHCCDKGAGRDGLPRLHPIL